MIETIIKAYLDAVGNTEERKFTILANRKNLKKLSDEIHSMYSMDDKPNKYITKFAIIYGTDIDLEKAKGDDINIRFKVNNKNTFLKVN